MKTKKTMNAVSTATAVCVLALIGAGSASAATVTYTYSGTVSGGHDNSGNDFGAVIADLTGDAFTLVYTLNTSLTNLINGTYGVPGDYKGVRAINDINFLTATLTVTIGGSPATFTMVTSNSNPLPGEGGNVGYVFGDSSVNSSGGAQQTLYTGPSNGNAQIQMFAGTNGAPFSLTASYTVTSGLCPDGCFLDDTINNAHVDLAATSLTVAAPPTVPLPAALPLFASGGGLIGLLAWRKKRKAAAAAA